MARSKKKDEVEKELEEGGADDVLKDMVKELSSLPNEVLEQLLENLNAIEEEDKRKAEEEG